MAAYEMNEQQRKDEAFDHRSIIPEQKAIGESRKVAKRGIFPKPEGEMIFSHLYSFHSQPWGMHKKEQAIEKICLILCEVFDRLETESESEIPPWDLSSKNGETSLCVLTDLDSNDGLAPCENS